MKKLFSFFSVITSVGVLSATDYATSSKFSVFIWFFCLWKKMSIYAMSFLGINCRWARTAKYILALRSEFKMFWITTRFIITKMVKNRNIFSIFSSRNFIKSCHNKSMDSISISFISKKSISKFVSTMSPIPTFRNWVNQYFREKSFFFFFGQSNFEIFHNLIVAHRN